MHSRGRRWKHLLPLLALCTGFGIRPALASPSLWGDSGLIAAPSDQMAVDGNLSIGMSRSFGPRSFQSAPVPNNTYFLNLAFLPRLEFVLIYNEVITGRPDGD